MKTLLMRSPNGIACVLLMCETEIIIFFFKFLLTLKTTAKHTHTTHIPSHLCISRFISGVFSGRIVVRECK